LSYSANLDQFSLNLRTWYFGRSANDWGLHSRHEMRTAIALAVTKESLFLIIFCGSVTIN